MASIFCFFVRNDVSGFGSTYLPQHTALLYQMADGYSSPDLALHCGAMLRECIKVRMLRIIRSLMHCRQNALFVSEDNSAGIIMLHAGFVDSTRYEALCIDE